MELVVHVCMYICMCGASRVSSNITTGGCVSDGNSFFSFQDRERERARKIIKCILQNARASLRNTAKCSLVVDSDTLRVLFLLNQKTK